MNKSVLNWTQVCQLHWKKQFHKKVQKILLLNLWHVFTKTFLFCFVLLPFIIFSHRQRQETLTEGSTVDLLTKVACCIKNYCNVKSSWSKLVCTRRSTVLSLQKGFLGRESKSYEFSYLLALMLVALTRWLNSQGEHILFCNFP